MTAQRETGVDVGVGACTGARLWALCLEVARHTHGLRPPNERYSLAVARLLLGTAAQESAGFRYRRQIGFRADSLRGAFGLWQCEFSSADRSLRSIVADIRYLQDRAEVGDRVQELYTRLRGPLPMPIDGSGGVAATRDVLRLLQTEQGDLLSCILARIHYLRVPAPIPDNVVDQARYWKTHYNTSAGKGKPSQYLRSWEQHCAQIVARKEV